MTTTNSRALLQQEIARSILLDEEDRTYLLTNLETLPEAIIQNLLLLLQTNNSKADQLMESALSQDQNSEHLQILKRKVADIKKKAFKIEETEDNKGDENQEENLLSELDQI